jgi:PAS domain S-box-containing protein
MFFGKNKPSSRCLWQSIFFGLVLGIIILATNYFLGSLFERSSYILFQGYQFLFIIIILFFSMSFVMLLNLLNIASESLSEIKKNAKTNIFQILDSFGFCMAVYSPEDNGDKFIFKDFNSAAEKSEDISREKVIGRDIVEMFPGIEKFGLLDVMKRVYRTGCPELHDTSKYKDKRLSGYRKNYVFKTDDGDIITAYQNLSEEVKSAEMQIKLATAINQAAETVMMTDPSGIIEYVNPAFERITGFSSNEAVGKTPAILKSGKHNTEFYDRLWSTIKTGKTWEGHFINRKKDGKTYDELAVISPVKDTNDRITSYIAVKRDVTREITLQEQLTQAQRMEAAGRLAGGIAHDFNNIFTAILGYSDIALSILPPDHKASDSVNEIYNAVKRAASLTKQLLAFTRKQVMDISVISLSSIISGMENILRTLVGERSSIIFSYPEEPLIVMANEAQIHQIIMNLVLNAKDAVLNKHGEIDIALNHHVQKYTYDQFDFLAGVGRYAKISVKDNGAGMDETVKKHIFEPFFTTKPHDKGTGLGLSTVHGIVKQFNGFIDIESSLGCGTTFEIFLPLAKKSSSFAATDDKLKEEKKQVKFQKKHRKTLLLVEDEAAIRIFLAQVLTSNGYNVMVAENGQKAMKIIEENAEKIDFLLSDIVMPIIGGDKLAAYVMDQYPEIKITLMSGYADAYIPNDKNGMRLPYIEKPFSPPQLLDFLSKHFT